jgi:Arc/MetJ-type ribon-helix-helix transcriptional regulator
MEEKEVKIITINLPERYLAAIQVLNDLGIYPSRSEAIRIALKDFLLDEMKFYEDIDSDKFKISMKANASRRD